MSLTPDLLVAATGCSLKGADVLATALDDAMTSFGIITAIRQAHFLAQTAFESGLYVHVEENLNYSADRLAVVFPRYFFFGTMPPNGRENAEVYARRPADIANVVYGGRMGNGNRASGDGWRYRGRGFIQLTGRSNYEAMQAACPQIPCITYPDGLCAAEYAALSAAWFWETRGCNLAADIDNVALVSAKINGGIATKPETINGFTQRVAATNRAKAALGI